MDLKLFIVNTETSENLFLHALCFFVLYYKTNIKHFFRIDIQLYSINTRGNWENSKLCENTPPFGHRVATQFIVFPISTRVHITVYQHGKCFIFVKYNMPVSCSRAMLNPNRSCSGYEVNKITCKIHCMVSRCVY